MSELMQRRDSDANNRIAELMATMQDLTLGVRAVVAKTGDTVFGKHALHRACPLPVQHLPQCNLRIGK